MAKIAISSWLARGGTRYLTKTLLVMKLTLVLLTVALFNLQAKSISQTVTLSAENTSWQNVFAAVKAQTGYVVFYNSNTLEGIAPVTMEVKNMELSVFLSKLLEGHPLGFVIKKDNIIISRKAPRDANLRSELVGIDHLIDTLRVFTGVVLNETRVPLSDVSIVLKKSKKGTVTDSSGKFSISGNMDDVLIVSCIGYEKQELKVSEAAMVIRLKIVVSPLDETVITAYGTTTKRLSTGNIGTVTAAEIERQPVLTILDAMVGRVPGVEITPSSGNSAAPINVTIRGQNSINSMFNNDPLYVIDGIPISNLNANPLYGQIPTSMGAVQGGVTNTRGENPLLAINPNDIESVSILKDADATAIYGSRGANGVILITTKKAKPGQNTASFNISNGFTGIAKYPKLLHTEEYLEVRREAFENDKIIPDLFTAPDLVLWDPKKYTDWQRVMVGTGSIIKLGVDVSGSSAQNSYRLSANYVTQRELMNNGGKNNRGTFVSTFSHSSKNQKFKFDLTSMLALTQVNAFQIASLGNLAPNAPDIYNSKGEFNFEPYRRGNSSSFPFSSLKIPSESNTFSANNNFSAQYELLSGLSIFVRAGYQFSYNENALYTPKVASDPAFNAFARANYGRSTAQNRQIEPQLKYEAHLGKGLLSVQLISSLQIAKTRSETISADRFPNDALIKSYNNAQNKSFIENLIEYKYLSFVGIAEYNWDRKYILKLNARRDGSSRFGPGKQFGNFGSIGMAWLASNENWLKSLLPSWISFLKLRGSYGITGADGIGDYEYLSRWSKNSVGSRTIFPYNGGDALHVLRPLNQEFHWESNHKSEAAFAVGLLQDKVNIEVSYYSEKSGNQLTTLDIPKISGFAKVVTNWPAIIRNSGLEITANGSLLQTKYWNLNLNFNLGKNRNKLISFPDLENSPYKGQLKVGYSSTTVFALRYTGIDPLTGSYTFEDYSKDGIISIGAGRIPTTIDDDRYLEIDYMPKFNGGFGVDLSYKMVSMSSQFSFVNKLRNDPYITSVPGVMQNIELPAEIKHNHWQKPGDQVKYPRYTTNPGSLGPISNSDAYFIKGSFIRLVNLAVSWSVPSKWLTPLKMKNARLSMQTQNLWTLTPYKGLDPERASMLFATPTPRIISTNLSFNF